MNAPSKPKDFLGTADGGSTPTFPFTPAKLRPRHDGWTAPKQVAFIEALAETACVEEACRRVGMSDSGAYALRRRPGGISFREAWDAAVDYGGHRGEQAAWSRMIHGVPRPIFYKGVQVGEWRHFDERLTMFLLRHRRPHRFGKWVEQAPAPDFQPDEPVIDEMATMLDARIDEIYQAATEADGDEA